MKLKLALIGSDISHSKSEEVYRKLLFDKQVELDYQLLDCSSSRHIPSLKQLKSRFDGVSITSPYKDHFLAEVQQESLVSGMAVESINCLRWDADGLVTGTSTDLPAVKQLLFQQIEKMLSPVIIILGDGAMSKLIEQICLANPNLSYRVYSRRKLNCSDKFAQGIFYLQDKLDHFSQRIWINCCARGFIYHGSIGKNDYFWDLNYKSPAQQKYITDSGGNYCDGLSLLSLQAEYALKFWNII
jgi:shikimate dehydrogenase